MLVTGASGFLGSHLTGRLVRRGAVVSVLRRDRPPVNSVSARWAERVTYIDGNVEDHDLVERAIAEHEVVTVFHLAAQSQVGVAGLNPRSTFETNVAGTWSVLEGARRAGRRVDVLVASSDKAYGAHTDLPYTEDHDLRPTHPYDVSKACADLIAGGYAKSFGLPVVITRCGNLFGPGDTNWSRLVPGTIRSLLRDERPVIRSDGRMTRDYLYVEDAVAAYVLLAELVAARPELHGRAYNFSSGRPLSVLDLVEHIQRAVGSSVEPLVLDQAREEIPDQWLSAERAEAELGWRPTFSIEEALAETVGWYRDHLSADPG